MGRGQLLTDKHKKKRLEYARKLLNDIDTHGDQRILFTDECLMPVGALLNRQNNRQMLAKGARKRYPPKMWSLIGYEQ
jgi:hypothetical protein